MRAVDVAATLLSHAAAVAFGCMVSLLWLRPDVPSLLLGLAMGVLVTVIGVLVVNLVKVSRGE